ncbi:uncharacterized protein [Primulina eburnea]|uniref:uncharacterized protein isoform X2 n=1 Tax=Primulina eburnea TaxID=1245227 RepID=UPI003C6CA689
MHGRGNFLQDASRKKARKHVAKSNGVASSFHFTHNIAARSFVHGGSIETTLYFLLKFKKFTGWLTHQFVFVRAQLNRSIRCHSINNAYRFYLLTQCFGLCVGSLLNLTRNSNNGGTKSRGFVVGALEWEYQREHTVLLGFIVLLSRSLSALCVKLRAGTISIQNT